MKNTVGLKIIITGAGGFVGQRLAAHLAQQGHQVTALVHPQVPVADNKFLAARNISVLPADLTRLNYSELPVSADAVYSLAQSDNFRDFPEKAEDIFNVNVRANLLLMQWARQAGVQKFILASSGGVYGDQASTPFLEETPLSLAAPLGFYLSTKLCAEIIFQNYRQYFQTAVIMRPFFIYGPGQQNDMLIPRLIKSVKEGRPIYIQGTDGLKINPVYVADAVAGFSQALELTGNQIINLAGSDILTIRQISEIIGGIVGRKPVFEIKNGQPIDYVGDIDQEKEKLALQPTSFVDGIALTLK
ncbi:MAG: NAD(P)-dependent oxidoreductase [bacterium]|nr:NAD(P)-dependent oxidoreductase [bacterium]MDD5353799.1 NAD(P)-dependent oxidoreductase [bacterium]MDD5756171.1 NAD(P)-dependent oxidoreductase [bacterium]